MQESVADRWLGDRRSRTIGSEVELAMRSTIWIRGKEALEIQARLFHGRRPGGGRAVLESIEEDPENRSDFIDEDGRARGV